MKLTFYAATDIGKRYIHNEDFFVTPEQEIGLEAIDATRKLFIICDGMGGANAGEVASEVAATTIRNELSKIDFKSSNAVQICEQVNEVIRQTHKHLNDLSMQNEQYYGMGTTLVSGLFLDNQLIINSVGDSRCYRLRGNKFEQLTEDQSEVWNLYKMGELSKEQIRTHPRGNIITMALGVSSNLQINSYVNDYQVGDLYLFCSDGLSDMVPENLIGNILQNSNNLQIVADELVKAALDGSGRDNITLILVRVEKEERQIEELTPPLSIEETEIENRKEMTPTREEAIQDENNLQEIQDDKHEQRVDKPPKRSRGHASILLMLIVIIVLLGASVYLYLQQANRRQQHEADIRGIADTKRLQDERLRTLHKQQLSSLRNQLAEQMVFVRGGRLAADEQIIDLQDFYISKYEITQQQWSIVTADNPAHFSGEDLPVESINWYDALKFCNSLSEIDNYEPVYQINGSTDTKHWGDVPSAANERWDAVIMNSQADGYRLPFQTEWHFAAVGGKQYSDAKGYPENIELDDIAWYEENSKGSTNPVGQKEPNSLGLYDMIGNVFEWCWDRQLDYRKLTDDDNHQSDYRILRGGSYQDGKEINSINSTIYSYYKRPEARSIRAGLRVVRNAKDNNDDTN